MAGGCPAEGCGLQDLGPGTVGKPGRCLGGGDEKWARMGQDGSGATKGASSGVESGPGGEQDARGDHLQPRRFFDGTKFNGDGGGFQT